MSSTATTIAARSLDQPDETRTPELATVEVINLGDHSGAGHVPTGLDLGSVDQAGSRHRALQKLHLGYGVSGRLDCWLTDGTRITTNPGDAYLIPPGHDAEVVGDEPFVGIESSRASTYAR